MELTDNQIRKIVSECNDGILIKALKSRGYKVLDKDDNEEDLDFCDLSKLGFEELVDELEDRGCYVFDEDGEYLRRGSGHIEKFLPGMYRLPELFSQSQLREHLLDITRLGSYVSKEDILNELKQLF